jgi:hypothetical protein
VGAGCSVGWEVNDLLMAFAWVSPVSLGLACA